MSGTICLSAARLWGEIDIPDDAGKLQRQRRGALADIEEDPEIGKRRQPGLVWNARPVLDVLDLGHVRLDGEAGADKGRQVAPVGRFIRQRPGDVGGFQRA